MKVFGRWEVTRVLPEIPDRASFGELLALRLKLLEMSRTLLALIKESFWVIEELNSEKLLQQMGEVADRFTPELKSGQADRLKAGVYEVIGAYLRKQRAYLNRKEAELKESIAILSDGLSSILTDNEQYHRGVLQLSDRLVDITRLDDIRQLKRSLAAEVTQLKNMVVEKKNTDAEKLTVFAAHISQLENKLKEAVAEAQRDSLIGSFNRTAWQKQLTTCLDYAAAHRHPFLLGFLRVDEFDTILTHFGSQIGNRVLVALYKACQNATKPTDFIARYAEETFSIIYPADPFRKVSKRLEHLIREMGASQYQFAVGEQTFTLGFTVSAGLVEYEPGDSRESIVARGLEALTLAEELGKNRLASHKDLKKRARAAGK